MGDRKVLYGLYAECLSVMPTDCLDVSNISSGNSRKVIMCSGLKMLMGILIWSVGVELTTVSQPITSVLTQNKYLAFVCVYRIQND